MLPGSDSHPSLPQGRQDIFLYSTIALPVGMTGDYLNQILYNIKETPTRVFIVHMLPDLAARVFYQATVAGMMSDGYIWIATSSIGTVVDSLSPDKIDHMQGVVTLRPYVEATAHVMNFTARLNARFRLENPGINDVHNPSTQLLWAYDTAWALAEAVHIARVSSSTPGRTLLGAMLNTTFDGMAGRFMLVNGHLQLSSYEIINIVDKGARTVGFWTPESRIIKNLKTSGAKGLEQILWPGHLATTPKGWDVSSNGSPLRIIVPEKQGFNQLVEVSYSRAANSFTVRGYCIDIFDMLMKNLPYPVAYHYVPVIDSSSSYDSLLSLVREKKADGMVGDTTITMSRMNKVSFTMPFTDTGLSMVVRLQPTVNSVQDLLRSGDYVGYHKGSTVAYWLEGMGFRQEILLGYNTVEEYADALQRGSGNGGVSAIFDEIPYLKVFLSKYREGYTMVGPTYKLGGFGFEEMERIEKKWFGDPGAQSKSRNIDSSSLGFNSFGGLFLISGTVAVYAARLCPRRLEGAEEERGEQMRNGGGGRRG
ncbi:hypothetical protein QYE76_028126 [Lolium multiflorum]|uniref:Ionotropic glutamate receptor C-terminal domain-containing protein n=1 Tax=Lolium multiflorum TaxID=4521 RepID=A0AAD8QNX2_LOLMU|nr:hypothetical protein QYE76_028126 [Lolium multiflorum]